MKKVLLILACSLSAFMSAQDDRSIPTTQPKRFPPPPVLRETIVQSEVALTYDSGGVTGTLGSETKKRDLSDTGGSGTVIIGGGKKLDGFATGGTGDTGGVKVPPDGKKLDFAVSGDPITKGSNDKKLDFETGGGTLPGGGGKKYEVARGDTGGRGQSIDPGKKYDFADTVGTTLGDSVPEKKLDAA